MNKYDRIISDNYFYIFNSKSFKFIKIILSTKGGQISKLKKLFFLKNQKNYYKCNYCFLIKNLICNYTYDNDKRFIKHVLSLEKSSNRILIKLGNELGEYDVIEEIEEESNRSSIDENKEEKELNKFNNKQILTSSQKELQEYEECFIRQTKEKENIIKSAEYLNELILKLSSQLKIKLIQQFNQFNDGLFFNLKTIDCKLKEQLLKENHQLILSLTNLELIDLYSLDNNLDDNNLDNNNLDNINLINNNFDISLNNNLNEDNLVFEISINNRNIIINLLILFQTFILDSGKLITDEFISILLKKKNQSLKILQDLKNKPINNKIMDLQEPTCSSKAVNKRSIDKFIDDNKIDNANKRIRNVEEITISSSDDEEEIDNSNDRGNDSDDIICIDKIEEQQKPLKFEERFQQFDLPFENLSEDIDLSKLIENRERNGIKNNGNHSNDNLLNNNHLNDNVSINKNGNRLNNQIKSKKNNSQINKINYNKINYNKINYNKEINEDNDRQVTINFEINNVQEFFSTIDKIKDKKRDQISTRSPEFSRYSQFKHTGDYSWKIQVSPVFSKDLQSKNLGFDIVCMNSKKLISKKNKSTVWKCLAEGKLSLVNQIPGKKNFELDFCFLFSNKNNTFGPKEYITYERLFNISEGFYKNDTIKLKAEIKLREDELILEDRIIKEGQKTYLQLVGLV